MYFSIMAWQKARMMRSAKAESTSRVRGSAGRALRLALRVPGAVGFVGAEPAEGMGFGVAAVGVGASGARGFLFPADVAVAPPDERFALKAKVDAG
jgi:hypothetical protein